MKEKQNFRQKTKVLTKLFADGCCTEKDLQTMTTERILQIPDITVPEINIILELQKSTKAGKLFSYLGDEGNEQKSSDEPAHNLE